MEDIKALIQELGTAHTQFRGQFEGRLEQLEADVDRMRIPGGNMSTTGSRTGGESPQAQEHFKAWDQWARRGIDNGLRDLEIQANMTTVSDPDGGFLVPVKLDTEMDRILTDAVAMRRIARVKSGLRGDYKRPFSQGGAGGGWVGENEARPETDSPDLTLFNPAWSEVYANPKVSQFLLDQAEFDVGGWLLDEIGATEVEKEGKAFVSGNGVKQPKGILSYDMVANDSWEWGKIGFINSGLSEAINTDSLIDLQHALKAGYRRNAVWFMNDATAAIIRKLKDGEGNYLWGGGLLAGQPETLLGKPVEIDDNMPDIAGQAFPVAFGDFQRGYLIGDHAVGRRLLRDPYSEKGQVYFYQTKRVFGGVIGFEAIKLLKIAA